MPLTKPKKKAPRARYNFGSSRISQNRNLTDIGSEFWRAKINNNEKIASKKIPFGPKNFKNFFIIDIILSKKRCLVEEQKHEYHDNQRPPAKRQTQFKNFHWTLSESKDLAILKHE